MRSTKGKSRGLGKSLTRFELEPYIESLHQMNSVVTNQITNSVTLAQPKCLRRKSRMIAVEAKTPKPTLTTAET